MRSSKLEKGIGYAPLAKRAHYFYSQWPKSQHQSFQRCRRRTRQHGGLVS